MIPSGVTPLPQARPRMRSRRLSYPLKYLPMKHQRLWTSLPLSYDRFHLQKQARSNIDMIPAFTPGKRLFFSRPQLIRHHSPKAVSFASFTSPLHLLKWLQRSLLLDEKRAVRLYVPDCPFYFIVSIFSSGQRQAGDMKLMPSTRNALRLCFGNALTDYSFPPARTERGVNYH